MCVERSWSCSWRWEGKNSAGAHSVQARSDQSSGRTSSSASELKPPEGDVLALLGRWEDGPATALKRDG
jgi:hypothetical protein